MEYHTDYFQPAPASLSLNAGPAEKTEQLSTSNISEYNLISFKFI